jgi:3-phosphoglycerate kinase
MDDLKLVDRVGLVYKGGGASLEFLSRKTLPGVEVLPDVELLPKALAVSTVGRK